jgi:HK97 family phage major capsid protein
MSSPVLEATEQRRARHLARLDDLVAKDRRGEKVDAKEMQKLVEAVESDTEERDELRAEERRVRQCERAAAEMYGGGGHSFSGRPILVGSEPMTYSADPAGPSFFKDLAMLARNAYGSHTEEARRRLQQHGREVEIESRHNVELADALERSRFDRGEQRVNPNTSATTGGEFIPPLWLVSQYVPFARSGRTIANRVNLQPLPPGIDVINLPKITVGALEGVQIANAAPVATQDIVTSTVSGAVRTIAGQEDISLQLLEQSPIAMDGVVFDDLSRDYDKQLDLQILTGTGSNGQHQGALTQTGATSNTSITNINLVTCSSTVFADQTSTGTQLRSIANAIQTIDTLRYERPTAIWVHPRRAALWAMQADTTGRPLNTTYGPFNATGSFTEPTQGQGVVGEILGLPVIADPNIPTTCATGAVTGGTGDCIVVVKEDDLYLWEGTLRLRALPEILSGTLQIRFQVYAYSCFIPSRFPPALSLITGSTGLAAPTF